MTIERTDNETTVTGVLAFISEVHVASQTKPAIFAPEGHMGTAISLTLQVSLKDGLALEEVMQTAVATGRVIQVAVKGSGKLSDVF